MSVFDLFRGFFGVPGGNYRGPRDPFFDTLTHDDEDDDDDDEDGLFYDGDQEDPFNNAWRFGFSFGPGGVRIQEPPVFGQVLREMEEIFSQMGRLDGEPGPGHKGVPKLPPPQDRGETGGESSSDNPLRDFMLKSHDSDTRRPRAGPSREPRHEGPPSHESPRSPFHRFSPFSEFDDIWKKGRQKAPEDERKEDRDLDSAVSSGGLDQILAPPAGQMPNQPSTRSFFQSVTVTKVVKPDGTVEEKRTFRDSQGREETTVTQSRGSGVMEGADRQTLPLTPGGRRPFSDMQDNESLFSRFFGGFK